MGDFYGGTLDDIFSKAIFFCDFVGNLYSDPWLQWDIPVGVCIYCFVQ